MAYERGYEGVLNYKVGGIAGVGSWVELTIVRNVTPSLEGNPVDVTTRANGGFMAYLPGLKDISVDVEMVVDEANAGYGVFRDAWFDGDILGIQDFDSLGNGIQFDAIVSSFGLERPYDGYNTVTATLVLAHSATAPTIESAS